MYWGRGGGEQEGLQALASGQEAAPEQEFPSLSPWTGPTLEQGKV